MYIQIIYKTTLNLEGKIHSGIVLTVNTSLHWYL